METSTQTIITQTPSKFFVVVTAFVSVYIFTMTSEDETTGMEIEKDNSATSHLQNKACSRKDPEHVVHSNDDPTDQDLSYVDVAKASSHLPVREKSTFLILKEELTRASNQSKDEEEMAGELEEETVVGSNKKV